MNDQLDDPAKSPAEGDEAPKDPASPSEQDAAERTGRIGPNQKTGGIRRPIKKRKIAPKRRTAGSTRPAPPAQPHVHHYDKLVDEGDDEGFFGKHRTKVVIAVIALIGGGIAYFLHSAKPSAAAPKAPERMVTISLPPPPPPPPPPPKREPPPPKEQKMVQETAAEPKPKDEAPKPVEPPKEALGTGVKGNGPGIAGLGSSGDGGGFGGPRGGNGGSKWGDFAFRVQNKVAGALRNNSHTNKASLKIQVRVWADSTGRITRAKLDASTGDTKLDSVIQNEVLTGLQLDQPPPAGMPMPIVMRLSARRP